MKSRFAFADPFVASLVPYKQPIFPFIQLLPQPEMGSQGVRPFWMRFLQLSFFPSFFFSVGFINWNLGFGRLTVETCSWFSPYWLRRELTRWLSKLPPQILNCKALMMTALLISLNLISITLYKEILSKAKLTIDFHCVQPNSSIRLHPSHHGDIFWTLNKRNFFAINREAKVYLILPKWN